MTTLGRIAILCGFLVLSACGGARSVDSDGGRAAGWTIADSSIRFGQQISPRESGTENASEFVWDGLGGGNRKSQVVGLFRSAIGDVAAGMRGPERVHINVVVTKFHALTDFGRIWCCGEHNIVADLEVVDAATGARLASGQGVYLGRIALGGVPGLIATAAGRDQEVRVREGIAKGIAAWLAGL